MLFNSVEFFLFLPVVLVLYHLLAHRNQNRMLLAASYLFYGWWDVRFLFLIVVSTAIDYSCGLMIERGRLTPRQRWGPTLAVIGAAVGFVTLRWEATYTAAGFPWIGLDRAFWNSGWENWTLPIAATGIAIVGQGICRMAARLPEEKRRRLFVTISIVSNLGILAAFKYCNFFLENVEAAFAAAGIGAERLRLDIVLPVGISFYTFQTMSYTIDIFRRKMKATTCLRDFALFVAFFPQLVAGPIERASNLLPRLLRPRKITFDGFSRGVFLIVFGLFKKVAVADGLARYVDSVYGATGGISGGDVAVATIAFAFQIYCDFSGYSDIARGVAKLMGIDLIRNFNLPYFSRSPSEFWQRWHISLSQWLRDYLYIPLGGNRHGSWLTYRNSMLTMILGGLWHGAAWNFVLWGCYQGGLLALFRAVQRRITTRSDSLPVVAMQTLGFFALTCYGWLLFRAGSFEQITAFTGLLADVSAWSLSGKPSLHTLAALAILVTYEFLEHRNGRVRFLQQFPVPLRGAAYASILFLICIGLSNEPAQFIYFQF
ncbi:MAG: MBOAT family O-acyltransferase [Planctomycetota bacterium]